MRAPALLQLATRSNAFVVRLAAFTARELAPLVALLSSAAPLKCGVGVDGDVLGLVGALGVALQPAGFVRLEELAHRARLQAKGVVSLAQALLGVTPHKSKAIQLSDWEQASLVRRLVVVVVIVIVGCWLFEYIALLSICICSRSNNSTTQQQMRLSALKSRTRCSLVWCVVYKNRITEWCVREYCVFTRQLL